MLDQHYMIGGRMIFLRVKVLNSIRSPLPMVWVRSSLIQLMFLKLIILIDLIFTNQPNFVTESGVHPPLHTNCHHQIKFAKPNLRVEYPPLYERLIWDYKNADIQSINRVIYIFYLGNSFKRKNVNEKVHFLNNPENFFNYISNKVILCNDKDPLWLNNEN